MTQILDGFNAVMTVAVTVCSALANFIDRSTTIGKIINFIALNWRTPEKKE